MKVVAQALIVSALLPSSALAVEPVALVLDVVGPVDPEVAPFDEIADGSVLTLGEGAYLTLSHYGLCEEVKIIGGTVVVGSDVLDLEGAQLDSRTRVQCPDTVVMSAADANNSPAALQAAHEARVMAPTPEFVLAGRWGRQFDRLDIEGHKGRLATLPIIRGRASWPEDLKPLSIGETYVVVLNGPGAKHYAARVQVTGEPQGMTVLKGS